MEGARRAKEDQKQQHHLWHDADKLQIHPGDRPCDRVFEGHDHTQKDTERDTDCDGEEADLQRYPEPAEKPYHVFAL